MSRHSVLSSILCLAAAVGWVRNPPPLGEGNRTLSAVLAPKTGRRLREKVIPAGLVLIGLTILATGAYRSESRSASPPENASNDPEQHT